MRGREDQSTGNFWNGMVKLPIAGAREFEVFAVAKSPLAASFLQPILWRLKVVPAI